MKILVIIALPIISALLYKLGGLHNNFLRRIGVPLSVLIACILLHPTFWIIPTVLLLFASLTTYWTPKSYPDVLWWGYVLSGIGIDVSALPLLLHVEPQRASLFLLALAFFIPMFGLGTVLINKAKFSGWSEVWRGFLIGIMFDILLF